MALILQERDRADEYKVKAGDTLESIAKKECPVLDWKGLATYNWGTDTPKEIVRALSENIGVKVADLAKPGLLASPQKIELVPDADLPSPVIRIPKVWKKKDLANKKTHKIKVVRLRPANAISITELDKWFIPEREKCVAEYELEGDEDRAARLQLEIYGSNYCECTDWKKGLGTYDDPTDLVDEPLYALSLDRKAKERSRYNLPDKGWTGEVNTKKGILSRTTGEKKKRFVNVAFSPYTTHFRYYKSDDDKEARLLLQAFWPKWKETKANADVVPDIKGGSIDLHWTNAEAIDGAALEIRDATKQLVHFEAISGKKLEKGDQKITWNKKYLRGAFNGKLKDEFIDDETEAFPNDQILFKSNPYSIKIITIDRALDPDSLKIKWEIKKTSKLKQGLIKITDAKDRLVFQKPLEEGKLSEGEQEFAWDGEYAPEILNSLEGTKAIYEDQPYRVQIQAHSEAGQLEAVALAAMHTEVRLYVPKDTYTPDDVRYSPEGKPSVLLELGDLVPGDEPQQGDGRDWIRFSLAKMGYHPGPVKGQDPASDKDYQIALHDFKRSVPEDGSAAAGAFTRQRIDDSEGNSLETAIANARSYASDNPTDAGAAPTDFRRWFGHPDRVAGNSEFADLSDREIRRDLNDPKKEVIVWIDDRHNYTTARGSKDENNVSYTTAAGGGQLPKIALEGYRGAMNVPGNRADLDENDIARPWIPLRAGLRLMSRKDDFDCAHADSKIKLDSPKDQEAMAQAIGPLRVDWTFEELGPDFSTISTGYDHTLARSRKYAAWAIHLKSADHQRDRKIRGDTFSRELKYFNCQEDLGGIRPTDENTYFSKALAVEDKSLLPWRAVEVADTHSIATVVHDHLVDGQKDDDGPFEKQLGCSGVYFNPSRIAGDGYRARAEVHFEKFDDYDFPNLDTLHDRYPVRPQANTARMRMWRKSSIRGYLCWGQDPGHWPNFINGLRDQYRAAHVYYVHEAGKRNTFPIAQIYDAGTQAHKDRYKHIITNNLDAALGDQAKMTLKASSVWPWNDQDNFGWQWASDLGIDTRDDCWQKYLQDAILENTWGLYSEALLYSILMEIEKMGFLRGNLLVEFVSSEEVQARKYECNRHASEGSPHVCWHLEKDSAAQVVADGGACPAADCWANQDGVGVDTASTLSAVDLEAWDEMPMWAEGNALGSTWLFTTSDADTWVHEVGHHRHFQHAASAPGAAPILHDTDNNEVAHAAGHAHTVDEKWDRDCIMSYTTNETLCFCGKCLLRNRGWKVKGLGLPGPTVREPA